MTEPIAAPAVVRAAAPVTAAALTTLAVAAAAWVVALRQMNGMDMGVETELGSFASFVGFWVVMMAAMMLPGAALAVFRRVRVRDAPLFVGAYLGVWTVVGVAAYAFYRPPGSLVAGVLTVAAGLYELTPLKRECRRRCRERVQSGLAFGASCLGSSIGLMLVLLALGVMSAVWMSLIAAVVFVQKLVPEQRVLDVPLALAIVGLGILIVGSPVLVPGLNPRI
jgi:predicted metal-binding membrane protein